MLGTKVTAAPEATASGPLLAGPDGALATRLVPSATRVAVGEEVAIRLEYVDGHGGLVGTVEDFGDGGPTLGSLKLADCRTSETNPAEGATEYRHAWNAPGTYTVRVTVTTDSCEYGQEESVATAAVTVA